MARIRNIKPEFFTSEAVSALPLRARLTWIGLWTHCDNHGRARDNVKLIKAAVWPLDNVSLRDIEEDLATLAEQGRIVRYEVDGKRYLEVTNWGEHQYGAFKGPAKCPGPDGAVRLNSDGSKPGLDESGRPTTADPVDNPGESAELPVSPAIPHESKPGLDESRHDLDESTGIQVSGVRCQGRGTREGADPSTPTPSKSLEGTRPADRCPRHLHDEHPPPCGPCADARRAAEQWDTAETERAAQIARDIEHACADPRMRCEHGADGGKFLHPITGKSATCAICRRRAEREAS